MYLIYLSENISMGYAGEYLVYKSYNDMQAELYEEEIPNKTPYFFYREMENDEIKYYYSNPIVWPSNKYDGDTDELISYGGRKTRIKNVLEGNKYTIHFYGGIKELLAGENFYTNIYYDENNKNQYLNQINQLISQVNRVEENSFFFIIKNRNDYDIIEVNYYVNSLNEAFFNHSKNEYISFNMYRSLKTKFER